MTTLIAWVSIDQINASAVYMAADSRLSWGAHGKWDAGRKIFASDKFPEILGYTGDVIFCSQALSQVVAFIDCCDPLNGMTQFDQKFGRVYELIQDAFSNYPKQFCLPEFSILYTTRIGRRFGACTFRWQANLGWLNLEVHYIPHTLKEASDRADWVSRELRPNISNFQDLDGKPAGIINFTSQGSGGRKFRIFYDESVWGKKLSHLSRSYFSAFVEFIATDKDKFTGGKPQLAALFRDHPPKKHGFVDDTGRHLYGIRVLPDDYQGDVRWVNRTFENCEPLKGKRLPDAQRQPDPSPKCTEPQ